MANEILYNDPAGGTPSEIGSQTRTDYYYKKALVEAAKEQYFGKLADTRSMPKNMGKKIKQFHYMPILDDRNINDQGIDATGATIAITEYTVMASRLANSPTNIEAAEASFTQAWAVGDIVFITDSSQWWECTTATAIGYNAATTGGASGTELTDANIVTKLELDTLGVAFTVVDDLITLDALEMQYATVAAATAATSIISGSYSVMRSGNLYGSSKDIGLVAGKIPSLTETGGRVNRVGMKRLELEGVIAKFGFFDEWSAESVNFDSDAELEMHQTSEMVKAANELNEDQIQIDLLNGAGVIRFTGAATSVDTLQGNTSVANADTIEYDDLIKLGIELDNNRTPKMTKIITGSRMIDTKVINAARYIYIGSELIPSVMKMTDYHSNQAFIPVAKYASPGDVQRGEIGAVGDFRFIVVPEMMKWAGAGATETAPAGFYVTGGKFDVFPMLVVGDASFTTIGFQTDGKTVKFKIKTVKPESNTAYSADNPFGELGFMSIKWYYGLMILRSERIAVVKTVAEY